MGKIVNVLCFSVAGLISILVCMSACSDGHIKPPLKYTDDESEAIARAAAGDLEDEAFENGNAAALFWLGLNTIVEGPKSKRSQAEGMIAASASLGFAPAFVVLSEICHRNGNKWAALVCLGVAAKLGHDEIRHTWYLDTCAFDKRMHCDSRNTEKREIDRILGLIGNAQSELSEIGPSRRRSFIHQLIHDSELKHLTFTPMPGDEKIEHLPCYRVELDGTRVEVPWTEPPHQKPHPWFLETDAKNWIK